MRAKGLLVFFLALAAAGFALAQKPSPTVEAWAMLFQMMDRLRAEVAGGDFTAVHFEDPVVNAAVSKLLSNAGHVGAPNNGLARVKLIELVREISSLHTAADAVDEKQSRELMKKADAEFQQLQSTADRGILEEARAYADRYTCAMHPEVMGAKDAACPKCGMPLEQKVVLLPSQPGDQALSASQAVRATIETSAPLRVGQRTFAVLHLRRAGGELVGLGDLIETHTKKIHLLIVDQSLTDYHHEHPRLTETPGDYVFEFTPRKPGPYLAWADLRPLPMGLQEYDQTTIAGTGEPERLTDRKTRLVTEVEGFRFELILANPVVKVGQPAEAKLRVTKADGSDFDQLEPVMAAFAHIVGFNEDGGTVLHLHPSGAPVLQQDARGGPELPMKIYATKAGFTRLFAQVQIEGRQIFAPFGLEVQP